MQSPPGARFTRSSRTIAIAVFLFSWTLTTHGKFSVTGDEPHYLMMTESLRSDADLDLANNYADDDGRLFGHPELEIGSHARMSRTGHMRSVHDIGLPVLLLPAYLLAQQVARIPTDAVLQRFKMSRGLFAYSIISLVLIAVTSFGVMLLAGAVLPLTDSRAGPLVVAAAAISPPIISYTFLVFPETVALFVTSIVIWYALVTPRPGTATALWLLLALGLLPWVHRKYSFYVIGLLFVLLWNRWSVFRQFSPFARVLGVASFLLPQIAFQAWTWHEWGTFGGPQMIEAVPFSAAGFGDGLAGLWFDRQHGVLAYAPMYFILPACCWLEWKKTWPFVVPAMLLYVPMAAYIDWTGGFSTAARYIVPIMPLALVPMASSMSRRTIRGAFFVLLVPQVLIDAVVWQHPRTLWPGAPATNAALESLGPFGRWYERLLPSIHTDGLTTSVIWLVLAVLLASAVLVVLQRQAQSLRNSFPPIDLK